MTNYCRKCSRFFRRHRTRSRSPKYSRREKLPSLPWERSDYIKAKPAGDATDVPKTKNAKNEEFRKLATAIENDLGKTLKQHEQNPEKHPQYNEEWKVFWNRRYRELQSQGQDAAHYDFKPEWILFWKKRMVELHDEESKKRKDALRKRYGITYLFGTF